MTEFVYTDRLGRVLRPGDPVRILSKNRGTQEGRVLGAYPQDPQGFAGCITVDLGMGIHEYVATSRLEKL